MSHLGHYIRQLWITGSIFLITVKAAIVTPTTHKNPFVCDHAKILRTAKASAFPVPPKRDCGVSLTGVLPAHEVLP